MASLGASLASFFESNDAASSDAFKKGSTHRTFIQTQILPLTNKLLRETRGRKFKEIQSKLKQAVKSLKEFQTQDWPAENNSFNKKDANKNNQEYPESADDDSVDVTELDVSMRSAVSSLDDNSMRGIAVQGGMHESYSHFMDIPDDMSVKPDAPASDLPADDPNTREPMSEAVIQCVEAYTSVLIHPMRTNKSVELALECIQLFVSKRYVSGRAGGHDDTSGSGAKQIEMWQQHQVELPPTSLLHQLIEGVTKCSETATESIQNSLIKTMLSILTSPKCGVHEASLLLALRSVLHVYLVTKTNSVRESSKIALMDVIRSVFGRMEAYHIMLSNKEEGKPTNHPPNLWALATQLNTDSYVIFRSLCKLSCKELPEEKGHETGNTGIFNSGPSLDPMALRNKILSLELILGVMELCSDAFCQGEKFIYLVQNYLCASLLKNCVSNYTQVSYLSQKIFLIVLYKFKGSLKQEIEVFMSNIFLRVLESPNSSFPQKALVLESLRSLCKDPVLLTQIFLNYDCDFDAMNLYKDIVHNLTKLSGKSTTSGTSASNSSGMTKKDIDEQFELSLAAVEVIVAILKAFLKALQLPGGENDDSTMDDTAGAKIRGMLRLDIGLATRPMPPPPSKSSSSLQSASRAKANESGDDETVPGMDEIEFPSTEFSAPTSDVAVQIVDAHDRKRNAEQNFEIGSVKFTLSLKSGLNFFIDNGFVQRDAKDVALFFLTNKDKLDKTQIGEALGREPDAAFVKGDDIDSEVGGPGFWVRILHHYVDAMDFTGLLFDEAIRLFLSGFRLPGEAQKIDRIMEKFAERFTLQNPTVFSTADTAFILAFSVIMLNTDLHNPSIKPERRMTLESFINNNRGIGENGASLPDEFLTAIFDRIKQRPFSLKEDDAARERSQMIEGSSSLFFPDGGPASLFGTSSEERKRERFKKEREEMMAATAQLIRRRPNQNKNGFNESATKLTDSVAPADVVKPMFDVTWGPVIGILSQVLEFSDDERSITVCLNGFVYAVRLASHSNMSLARNTFVTSLAKFTFLGSIKEMKRKNIESIRTLLSIAVIDGEFLGESWGSVLQCISQLARLRLSASGLDSDESFLSESVNSLSSSPAKKTPPTPSRAEMMSDGGGLFRQHNKSETARETEENNGRFVLQAVNEVLIDKVFSSTVNLSAHSLADFIEQLIHVSQSEIAGTSKSGITGVRSPAGNSGVPNGDVSGGSISLSAATATGLGLSGAAAGTSGSNSTVVSGGDGPSIFSLQRLVEVVDYNVDVRPKFVWAQIWPKIADFFALIGSHENGMVSVFAIDSLKQLSFKFLDKPELSEFNFQRIFLMPFLQCLEHESTTEEIGELVMRCIDNIVRSKAHNLRSGWKIIFSILARAATDSRDNIKILGLAILQRLLDEHLHQLCSKSAETTSEVTNTTEGQDLVNHSRTRNSDAEDFVGLCRASLAFVKSEEDTDSPRPDGLSMRALCHSAIYADILAADGILPPISGAQWTDPTAPGYTYKDLDEKEALDMVLWRHLLEGLANGIRFPPRTIRVGNNVGVGCWIQRGSILALRSIFIRHGHKFSISQWKAILQQTLLPAIQSAAENDTTPVVGITSESPSVSSIDFLATPLPVPPPATDSGLKKFEIVSESKRPFGPAELLLEASFTDMRHGGDGNLRRAYLFAKKDIKAKVIEQPFPNSWVATTSTIALGLLTDITSEIIFTLGTSGREVLWPVIADQYKLWCLGSSQWKPCEALVRVACGEFFRIADRVVDVLPRLEKNEASGWTVAVFSLFSDTLNESVATERTLQYRLQKSQNKDRKELKQISQKKTKKSRSSRANSQVDTPYGKARLVKERVDSYEDSEEVVMRICELEFGALLYSPSIDIESSDEEENVKKLTEPILTHDAAVEWMIKEYGPKKTNDSPVKRGDEGKANWLDTVAALKIRCVAVNCLQQALLDVLHGFVPWVQQLDISSLITTLSFSQRIAEGAVQDEDVKLVFQEAIVSEWGDGVEEVEMALSNVARLSHLHGSDMFFLTQEAGATHAIFRILTLLMHACIRKEYVDERVASLDDGERKEWGHQQYAEPLILRIINDVLRKFLESEEKDGHLIDESVWRNLRESGGKVALYCTTFAKVVEDILKLMLSLKPEHFVSHKQDFFPFICSLVRVQSDEIRNLVQRILSVQVAAMIGVEPKENGEE